MEKLKRYLSIVTAVALCLSLSIVSVSADSDDSFINMLDFGYSQETGTNDVAISGGSGSATYLFPFRMSTSYVDMTFTYYAGYDITSVAVYHSNGNTLNS